MQTIKETVPLLLICVGVMRGIPSQGVELVKILDHLHVVLLQIVELVPLHLDQSSWNVGLAELGSKLLPVHHVAFNLHCLNILPPCSCRTSEKVCCKANLLILTNSSNLQVVFNGAEPVVRIKRCSALGEHGWVGILEVPQLGPWCFFTIPTIVVSRGVVVSSRHMP